MPLQPLRRKQARTGKPALEAAVASAAGVPRPAAAGLVRGHLASWRATTSCVKMPTVGAIRAPMRRREPRNQLPGSDKRPPTWLNHLEHVMSGSSQNAEVATIVE